MAGDRVEHRLRRRWATRCMTPQDLRGGRLLLTRLGRVRPAGPGVLGGELGRAWAGLAASVLRPVSGWASVGSSGGSRPASFSKQLLQSSKDRRHRVPAWPRGRRSRPASTVRSWLPRRRSQIGAETGKRPATGMPARSLSSEQRSPCAGIGSTRQAISRGKDASSESRCPGWDPSRTRCTWPRPRVVRVTSIPIPPDRSAWGSARRAGHHVPRSRMSRAAFAQSERGRRVAWTTSRPGSACNSTSSGSWA